MIEHAIQLGATDIHIQQGSIYWRLGMDVCMCYRLYGDRGRY